MDYSAIASRHFDKQEYEKAAHNYTEAIKLNPDDSMSYEARGTTLMAMNLFGIALSDFSRAIELNPNISSHYTHRARCFISQYNYSAAIIDYTSAIKINP